jgi:uncharacterized membrane protein
MTLQKQVVSELGVRRALGAAGWRMGLGLILVAAFLQAWAISLGDVSVVKPLGMVQCVFALGIGMFFLHERLGRAEVVGAVFIVGGGVLLAAGGGPQASQVQAGDPGTRVVVVALVALALLPLLVVGPRWHTRPELALALAAGVLFGSGDTLLKVAFEVVREEAGVLSLGRPHVLAALGMRPEFSLFLVGNAAGLALHQLAYRSGRIAVIAPVSTVTSAAVPAALGVVVLGEPLGLVRAVGVILLLGGGALVGAPPGNRRPASRSRRCGRISA